LPSAYYLKSAAPLLPDQKSKHYGKVLNSSDAMPLGAIVPEPTVIGFVISGMLLAYHRRK
jgi:hypothetical protein